MLWIAKVHRVVHVVLEIHGQMTIEMAALVAQIRLIVAVQTGAGSIIIRGRLLRCTAGFIWLHISFAAEPMPGIRRLIFRTPTESKYRNQLVVTSCKATIRLIELTMAHNHL